MSLFNKLRKAAKRFSTKVGSNIKKLSLIKRTKREMLERFELPSLKDACKVYGVDEPVRYKTSSNGNKYRVTPERKDFIYELSNNLKLEQIRNYANRHKIRVEDIISNYEKELKEIKDTESKKYNELDNSIGIIAFIVALLTLIRIFQWGDRLKMRSDLEIFLARIFSGIFAPVSI